MPDPAGRALAEHMRPFEVMNREPNKERVVSVNPDDAVMPCARVGGTKGDSCIFDDVVPTDRRPIPQVSFSAAQYMTRTRIISQA